MALDAATVRTPVGVVNCAVFINGFTLHIWDMPVVPVSGDALVTAISNGLPFGNRRPPGPPGRNVKTLGCAWTCPCLQPEPSPC
jgi:hypothetical protein